MTALYLDTRTDGKRARIRGLSPEMLFALMVIREVFYEHHEEVAISCGCDGTHTRRSPHYMGHALDLRRPKDDMKLNPIIRDLTQALGPDFQVLTEVSHLHVQYWPSDPLNAEGAAVTT